MNKRFTFAEFSSPLMTSILTETASSRLSFQEITQTFGMYKSHSVQIHNRMSEFQKALCSLALCADHLSEDFMSFSRAIKKNSDQNAHKAQRTASKLHDYFERFHSALNEVVIIQTNIYLTLYFIFLSKIVNRLSGELCEHHL